MGCPAVPAEARDADDPAPAWPSFGVAPPPPAACIRGEWADRAAEAPTLLNDPPATPPLIPPAPPSSLPLANIEEEERWSIVDNSGSSLNSRYATGPAPWPSLSLRWSERRWSWVDPSCPVPEWGPRPSPPSPLARSSRAMPLRRRWLVTVRSTCMSQHNKGRDDMRHATHTWGVYKQR